MNGLLILPNCNTAKFGTKAFLYSTITSWNSFQTLFAENNFRVISPISLKKLFKDYLIFQYHEIIQYYELVLMTTFGTEFRFLI